MSEKIKSSRILGIDLGTTNSCITVYDETNKKYITIPSLEGNPLVPSALFMKDNVVRVGDKAREEIKHHPENVILSVKSYMDTPRHKFTIENAFKSEEGSSEATLTPIEISAYILRYIKKCAEEFIGETIEDVVITVPAYFKEVERKATKRAASRAGLNLMEIINEPTSACLAYGYAVSKDDPNLNILVYDLGGGTFDVTLLNMSPDVYEVISTDGMKLGGDDIDLKFMEYLEKRVDFGKATPKQAKFIVEEAKKSLSSNTEVEVDFTEYGGGKFKVTTNQFDRVISPIVNQTIAKVLGIIEGHKIDEVVLVGGSTRTPLIKRRLAEVLDLDKNYFDKYKIDPDLAVSVGACIRGRIISGLSDIILIDKTPFNIGVEVDDGTMDAIIKRGSVIPTLAHSTYTNTHKDVEDVLFKVYQGNELIAANNQYLGELKFKLDTTLQSSVRFKVTFRLDSSGVLSVEVLNLLSMEKQHVEVKGVVD